MAGPQPHWTTGNPTVSFRGEKHRNVTHASRTDPDARLFKKAQGQEAKLCFMGHVLIENRHGLVVSTRLTHTGQAEWEAAVAMTKTVAGRRRITVGGDRHYDDRGCVAALRALQATPHVAQKG